MIDRERWQRDRDQLLERAGLQDFTDPKKVLGKLDDLLYQQYLTTNAHIEAGDNALISFDKNGAFRLKTPKQDESEAEPLQAFFPDRHYVSLLEVLATVNRYSGFLDDFQHWQQRYHRQRPPQRTFLAGIVGLGCGIGTRKMARISNQINEAELDHTVNWFFSTEGAHAANDRVVRLMDQLELPNVYRRLPGQLHTSSDGQKFEVRLDSLNAIYSFKYFGKYQGVSGSDLWCHPFAWFFPYAPDKKSEAPDALHFQNPPQCRPLAVENRSGRLYRYRLDRVTLGRDPPPDRHDQAQGSHCLSQKIAEADNQATRDTLLEAIASGSVVSWQQIFVKRSGSARVRATLVASLLRGCVQSYVALRIFVGLDTPTVSRVTRE